MGVQDFLIHRIPSPLPLFGMLQKMGVQDLPIDCNSPGF
jgi:hypothetical protein